MGVTVKKCHRIMSGNDWWPCSVNWYNSGWPWVTLNKWPKTCHTCLSYRPCQFAQQQMTLSDLEQTTYNMSHLLVKHAVSIGTTAHDLEWPWTNNLQHVTSACHTCRVNWHNSRWPWVTLNKRPTTCHICLSYMPCQLAQQPMTLSDLE